MSSLQRIFIEKHNIFEQLYGHGHAHGHEKEGERGANGGRATVILDGEQYHHLCNVLRLKRGERLVVCDGCGNDYEASVMEISGGTATLLLDEPYKNTAEFAHPIVLFQGLPKGDKLDMVVQKAVELGASAIVPVLFRRCVSKPDARAMEKKVERLNKIAASACAQCGRGIVPRVEGLMDFSAACRAVVGYDTFFLCHEDEKRGDRVGIKDFLEARGAGSTAFIIGPEGGIDDKESEEAAAAGIPFVSLGKRILRTETAGMFVLSVLSVFNDN